ncbi:PROTEIN SHROOM-LIKE [Salix viminalis]|uniref:PROTEIN SHROOM-LIKE n=1 Tax=Salix viminalis TaxID=40686 RepID=A0A9Q0NZ81_SALVM|nr:PROTEIN SHROOM-LIKE [Salix viminalis]
MRDEGREIQAGYGRLDKEPDTECLLEGELKTSGSSPSDEVSGSPKGPELAPQNVSPVNPRRRKGSKSHPLFSLCDGAGRKKNTTARPEFARYLQYVKEGGVWINWNCVGDWNWIVENWVEWMWCHVLAG